MTEVLPKQVTPEAPAQPDHRTSEMGPRIVPNEGGGFFSYSPVVHDKPVTERKLKFGRARSSESLSVSRDQAVAMLSMSYGMDVADSLLARAERSDGIVNGTTFEIRDSQAKVKGNWSVTRDKSREGVFAIWSQTLVQSGGRVK
jgi:hypothetical protein